MHARAQDTPSLSLAVALAHQVQAGYRSDFYHEKVTCEVCGSCYVLRLQPIASPDLQGHRLIVLCSGKLQSAQKPSETNCGWLAVGLYASLHLKILGLSNSILPALTLRAAAS